MGDASRRGKKRVGMVSLGCPKNLVDSEQMLGLLKEAGYALTPRAEEADLLLLNTCAFIQSAQEESIEAILEMANHKENGPCRALVVVGCLPQRFGPSLAAQMPEVDAWAGVGQVHRVVEVCQSLLEGNGSDRTQEIPFPGKREDPLDSFPRVLCTPPHYAYLKISEGCRNHCAYCVIPSIRGELRSRPPSALLTEARELVDQGVKELILVAQDLGDYGKDLDPQASLPQLLEGLCQIDALEWIRLLYLHPAHVPDELIRLWAHEAKICPYLDLPLQHIDDRILKAMNRGVSSAQIYQLIDRLKSSIPQLSLRTTLLVGFPGEGEKEFSSLLRLVEEVGFDHLGAFPYSREEGTPASRMKGQVRRSVKEERLGRIMEMQAEISRRSNQRWLGTRQRVLIDGIASLESPLWKGRTSRQAPEIDGSVLVRGPRVTPGEFMEVKIVEAETYDLVGEHLG